MGADLVCEGGDASDASAHYQGVDVVRALVGVDGLEVHHVPDDVVLIAHPVPPEHVPALPGDGERLAAVVPLQDGNHLRH